MREILAFLQAGSAEFRLDRAALAVAGIEFPGLDARRYVETLDRYAAELARRVGAGAPGPEFLAAANRYLFQELAFRGNTVDYYDPRNSCLNAVIENRTGIPITLSILYMEIARRLGRPVKGIGLPGHFIVQYDDGDFSTYLDPFHGGLLLDAEHCFETARHATGSDLAPDPALLAPVSGRQILLRLLGNLRVAYVRRSAFGKAIEVLDILLGARPDAVMHKERAVLRLQMKQARAGLADLIAYLKLSPDAPDKSEIEKQVRALKQYLAALN